MRRDAGRSSSGCSPRRACPQGCNRSVRLQPDLTRMICVEITAPGGPEVLKAAERPDPVPGPGEVLIRVAAAGVNRPDVLQRRGAYPPPPGASDIPGLEVSGTIASVGDGVDGWR